MDEPNRRRVARLLGLLWLSAAALQAQPFLFTGGFARDVLAPNGLFQPAVVAAPVHLAARIVGAHPAVWNSVFVLTELTLAAGLLTARSRRFTRAGCVASAVWALSVWWVGEGAGGLLTGHASLSTGAPGAALLYAAVSVACMPASPQQPTKHERRGGGILTATWAAVWTVGGLLVLLPGQASAVAIGDQLGMGSMMSPAVLSRPEAHFALAVSREQTVGAAVAVALAVVYVVVGLAPVCLPARRNLALHIGLGLTLLFWLACQGFGGLSTGAATDVGAAPMLALIGYATRTPSPATASRGRGLCAVSASRHRRTDEAPRGFVPNRSTRILPSFHVQSRTTPPLRAVAPVPARPCRGYGDGPSPDARSELSA